MQFKKWSILLPRLLSSQVDCNATYTLARQNGNPNFFDQARIRLVDILQDCEVLKVSGKSVTADTGIAQVLRIVLESLMTASGFLSNRHFHKATAIGELCVQVADAITAGFPELVFWPLLCRSALGDAYVRLRRRADARAVLETALEQAQAASLENRLQSSIRVVAGACHFYLARADLEEGLLETALPKADAAIEDFDGNIWDLSDSKEDREDMAMVVATTYIFRGNCDSVRDHHEVALSWYRRSLQTIESNRDLGSDYVPIVAQIKLDIERTECLHTAAEKSAKS